MDNRFGMGIKNKNALNHKVVGADEAYGSLFPANKLPFAYKTVRFQRYPLRMGGSN
jgi:hypothetical protein